MPYVWIMPFLYEDFEGYMYHVVKVREKGSSVEQLQTVGYLFKIYLKSH